MNVIHCVMFMKSIFTLYNVNLFLHSYTLYNARLIYSEKVLRYWLSQFYFYSQSFSKLCRLIRLQIVLTCWYMSGVGQSIIQDVLAVVS